MSKLIFFTLLLQIIKIMQQNSLSLIMKTPTSYFDLIEKVGSRGRYQKWSFVLFLLLWLITSLMVMGTSFLFLNPKLNCDSIGLDNDKCQNYVCSLPDQQISKYYAQQDLVSLATEFGPFHCGKALQLSALRMTLFVGIFFGYMFVFYFTDNFGRKYSMVLAWSITVLGIGILSAALNIQMACAGLFLTGFGSETTIRITMTVIGETVENSLRQKYSIALQISFGIGSMTIGIAYLLIGNWRIITIAFCLIPAAILLFLVIFYLEQTPKFLIQKDFQKAVKSLNRIGQINGSKQIITLKDVQSVAASSLNLNQKRTPLDLCRFPSIRSNFIFSSIFLFCITFLYFGPSIIISDLPLNIFASQIILGATEAISYPFCILFIENLPRKKSGYVLMGIPSLIFLALVFIEPQQNCQDCFWSIMSVILVFLARFCICAYFSVFFLYMTEIFPLPLRGIGFGMASLMGSTASILSQFILSSISQTKINPMVLFVVISAIGCGTIKFLPETMGKKMAQEIEEQKGYRESIKSEQSVEKQEQY